MTTVPTSDHHPPSTVPSSKVLVVDDEPSICWAFEKLLGRAGHEVLTASTIHEGLQLAESAQPDLMMVDVRLPDDDGLNALPKFLELVPNSPVVIMTAFGDLETAVTAVERGASEYLIKPFKLEDAQRVCESCLAARQNPPATRPRTKPVAAEADRIVGSSPAIQATFRQIALVARSRLSVLITGETGTGKELVAAAIHRHSERADAPYLPIAPVALNPDVIESELFGHVKGAFTGASEDRAGVFELAEGGTILLDEIGELSLGIQAKLLRVLERGEYCRVGEIRPRRCNVRILAATNCNLYESVKQGTFREDLYYRLNGLHIHLPPLRERREDIAELGRFFLERMDPNLPCDLGDDVLHFLRQQAWQGNVRELRNAVEHAAVVARGRAITIADFPIASSQGPLAATPIGPEPSFTQLVQDWVRQRLADSQPDSDEESPALLAGLLAEVEPALFEAVLKATDGNRARAATLLGLHRGTLREKLRAYGIDSPSPQ